jgi:hypothetical protein
MTEYFLIVYTESSDEIHFMIMDMLLYDKVIAGRDKFANRDWSEAEEFLEFCYKNKTLSFFIQTYCVEPWIFEKYKIKAIVSIPEFGC